MTYEGAEDVFARREDAEWQMFLRGAGGDAGPFCRAVDDEPVSLEPGEDSDVAAAAPAARVRHFFAPVVGLPYPNADGTSRREAVRGLRRRERVRLVHRPDNPVDANAVAVLRPADERQLGYLPAAVAKDAVTAARQGTRYVAMVSEVTGGDGDNLIYVQPVRARLLVLVLEGGAKKHDARRYMLALMKS